MNPEPERVSLPHGLCAIYVLRSPARPAAPAPDQDAPPTPPSETEQLPCPF